MIDRCEQPLKLGGNLNHRSHATTPWIGLAALPGRWPGVFRSMVRVRVLAGLLCLVCLVWVAGCGASRSPAACTLVGCVSGLSFRSPRLSDLMASADGATVRVCLDGACRQTTVARGTCAGELLCGPAGVTMFEPGTGDLIAAPHTASITVTGPDGATLLDERRSGIRFGQVRPNGPDCPPVCYAASIQLPG